MGNCILLDISILLACGLVLSFGSSAGSSREVDLSSPTSHYTFITNKLSWHDAQDACAQASSHLVCVNSAEESEYLQQAVQRSELPTKYYWIGLVVADDGEWAWQDGTGLGYTNWWSLGGSSGGSESDEDSTCVTVYMSTQQWRTKKCNKINYYICERELANDTVTPGTPLNTEDTTIGDDSQKSQSTTELNDDQATLSRRTSNTTSTENVCPDGFELFESSCYHLISETLTDGNNSRNACANVHPGSHLAFIESQSEQTFLVELIMTKESKVDFWFGLTFTSDVDHPEWMDGRPLGDFAPWDNYGVFDERSPCVRLRRRSDYFWNDRPCTGYEFGCVCEIENNQAVTPTSTVTAPSAQSPQTKEAVYKASPSNMAAPMGSHHLQSMSALSLFRCATYCLRHNNCASFNYKSAEGRSKLNSFCELYSMQFTDEELVVKRGYRYYKV